MSAPEQNALFGHDLLGDPRNGPAHGSRLGDAFMLPPFTILNAREGWWQDRKREWLSLGIQSELGRGGDLLGFSPQVEIFRQRGGKHE